MRCVNTKPVGTDPKTGKQLVEAMIIADTEPENLPTTGEGGFCPVQPDLCAG